MCRIFAQNSLWQRAESGEFELHVWKRTSIDPAFIDYRGQRCVFNEDILILDHTYPITHHRHEVARVHRFITDQGTIGATGLPDPKEITLGDTNYRGLKSKNPHCELCEGGDMIPHGERFVGSKYRPQ